MSADGERRGEPRQKRRVAEALSRFEDVDYLLLVHKLHRAVSNDVEGLGWLAVLDERNVADAILAQSHCRSDLLDLRPLKAVKGRMPCEERRSVRVLCLRRLGHQPIIGVVPTPRWKIRRSPAESDLLWSQLGVGEDPAVIRLLSASVSRHSQTAFWGTARACGAVR